MTQGYKLFLILAITLASNIACSVFADSFPLPTKAPVLSDPELSQLRKGRVLAQDVPYLQGTDDLKAVQIKIMIDRPVEQVWQALQDQETLFRGEKHLKQVKLIKKTGNSAQLVEYSLQISRLLPLFVYTAQVDYLAGRKSTQFSRLSGSFKSFYGLCHLTPVDSGNKTVMTYTLSVDPGFFIPNFLVRQALKGEIPQILSFVKSRVYSQFPAMVSRQNPSS